MKHHDISAQKLNGSTAAEPKSDFFRFFNLPFKGLLVLIFFLFISSCKDDVPIQTGESNKNFKDHLKALYRHTKSPETALMMRDGIFLTISEAEDYLNEGLNFFYCRPNDFYNETVVVKDTFAIAISSGLISSTDLDNLLFEIAEFAGEKYYDDAREEKEPLMFDVRHLYSANPYSANIEATFAFEGGTPLETIDEYPYEDSWLYARWFSEENEECNEEETTAFSSRLFARDLKLHLAYRNQTTPFYLINPVGACFDPFAECTSLHDLPPVGAPITQLFGYQELHNPNDIPNDSQDNLFDYLLFKNTTFLDNFDTCLDVEEMNFYYESMHDLILELLPSPAGNTVIAQIEVGYDRLLSTYTTIWHVMKVSTATRIPVEENNESPLPLPYP